MAGGARIGLTQRRQLRLTPGLRHRIELLRLDAEGLTRLLQDQAAENPYLQLDTPAPDETPWQPRWLGAFASLTRGGGTEAAEAAAAPGPSLMAHVLDQVDRMFPDPADHAVAIALAEGLEPSGRLGRPLADVARHCGRPLAQVQAVLARLQRMDPRGLFARDLAECLRLQAAELAEEEGTGPDPVLAWLIDRLDLVAQGDVARLARLCGTDQAAVARALRRLRSLDPKPGARFDPGAVHARAPDLVATPGPDGWQVTLNGGALPVLRVRRPEPRPVTPGDRARLAQALALERGLSHRNATLLRVARAVAAHQAAALAQGPGALRPLAMVDLAAALGLHDSTVSRVVAGVVLATPAGTYPLRSFFCAAQGDSSPPAIRAEIARLIAAEDPARPLSDADLADRLGAAGRSLARRTVAKYRRMLRIPRAGLRRLRRDSKPGRA